MNCEEFWRILQKEGFTYFAGVPDSTFKSWMSFLGDMDGEILTNRICAIERDAVGWASGYHVATRKTGVVYMQNSGLGNTVNPITSLIDPEVYQIPILFFIGWRGEPGKPDEPQHVKMGKVTLPLLYALGIEHSILPKNVDDAQKMILHAREYMEATKKPYALIIRRSTLEPYEKQKEEISPYELTREDSIKILADSMKGDEIIVSTTGKTSRELFEYREEKNFGHQNDFLMVGSMGLASSFGAEISLQKPNRKVFIFDGDGALLMSQGVLSTIGYYCPKNLFHIVFDNGSHESTGGQPTTSKAVDFEQLAFSNSYAVARTANTREELTSSFNAMKDGKGPQMLIVKVKTGSRKDLGRPTTTPIENKEDFMKYLQE